MDGCLSREIQKHFGTWSCIGARVAKAPDAYRQARSRSRRRDPTLTAEAFAARLIEEASPVLLLPRTSDGIALCKATSPIAPPPPKPLALSAVLDILHDIAFGHSADAIALRSNRSLEEIGELGRVAIDVLQRIGEADRRKALPSTHRAVLELQACLQSGAQERIQFQRVGQAKVAHIYDVIASGQHPEIVTQGIDAWERCYQHGYVSLDPVGAAFPFVTMLNAGDFPRYLMWIRGMVALERTLMTAFRADKSGTPRWESIQGRPGRPKAYLTLASHSHDQSGSTPVGNAALGMGGVHAVMFAAAVRRRISSPTD